MSKVLLGLPVIPSGQQVTKTFTYKREQQFDFMLGKLYVNNIHSLTKIINTFNLLLNF